LKIEQIQISTKKRIINRTISNLRKEISSSSTTQKIENLLIEVKNIDSRITEIKKSVLLYHQKISKITDIKVSHHLTSEIKSITKLEQIISSKKVNIEEFKKKIVTIEKKIHILIEKSKVVSKTEKIHIVSIINKYKEVIVNIVHNI